VTTEGGLVHQLTRNTFDPVRSTAGILGLYLRLEAEDIREALDYAAQGR
jgi:hypothetical protein